MADGKQTGRPDDTGAADAAADQPAVDESEDPQLDLTEQESLSATDDRISANWASLLRRRMSASTTAALKASPVRRRMVLATSCCDAEESGA